MSAAKRPLEELTVLNRARKTKTKNLQRDYLRELKKEPCVDCDQRFHWAAMDFDHVRGTKMFNISFAATSGRVGMERLKAEVAKCDLVCSNCHRVRTFVRRQQADAQRRDRTSDAPTHHVGSSSTEVPAQEPTARDGIEPPASPETLASPGSLYH